MRHYKARQRKDGRWDYTVNLGNYITPIGYCTPYREWTQEDLARFGFSGDEPDIVRGRDFADRHHDCGHATPEEANECYRQYQLDQELSLMRTFENTKRKCLKCGDWTQHFAEINMSCFDLCEKHNTRESVAELFSVDESWAS